MVSKSLRSQIMKCTLCNGEEEYLRIVHDSHTGLKKVNSEYCLCKKAAFISEEYSLLDFLGGDYLPLDKIDKRLRFMPGRLKESPNIIIMGDFTTFCYHVKSVIIQHRFVVPAPYIYLCRAIDLLQKFHVPQEDGTTPHISSTDRFDLLIFTCDTYESNQALDGVIAQVVNNRKGRKPTWIHFPRSPESCRYEYSEELAKLIKDYEKIALTPVNKNGTTKQVSKAQTEAANFRI